MNLKNKKIIAGVVGVIILLLIVGLALRGNQAQKKEAPEIPTEEIIPTVDSSVKVELKELKKSVAALTIKDAPNGTKKIEYLVAYDAKPGPAFSEDFEGSDVIPQGFQGTCSQTGGIWECGNKEPIFPNQRVIVFGSSSSGVYRFHDIIGTIKVTLQFSGSYGAKSFEKDYSL